MELLSIFPQKVTRLTSLLPEAIKGGYFHSSLTHSTLLFLLSLFYPFSVYSSLDDTPGKGFFIFFAVHESSCSFRRMIGICPKIKENKRVLSSL